MNLLANGIITTPECFQLFLQNTVLPDPIDVWYGNPLIYRLGTISFGFDGYYNNPVPVRYRQWRSDWYARPFNSFAYNLVDGAGWTWSCTDQHGDPAVLGVPSPDLHVPTVYIPRP